MAYRVCACIGCPAHPGSCPELTTARHCPPCATQAELRRGTRHQRGYGRGHELERRKWKPQVEAGLVDCHAQICTERIRRILPGQPWDLGHDDQRRHRGPEHAACNRAAGAQTSNRHRQ